MRGVTLAVVLVLAACDPSGGVGDDGGDRPDEGFDAFLEPTVQPDAGGADVPRDRRAPCDPMLSPSACLPMDGASSVDASDDEPVADAPPEDLPPPPAPMEACAPVRVIDANARGIPQGRLTYVHLTPEDFSPVSLTPVAPCPTPSSTQVVLRYTTNAPASLAVYAATDEGAVLDGALWVADRCVVGAPASARPMACSRLGSWIFEPGRSADAPLLVQERVAPAAPVYVVLTTPPTYVGIVIREVYDRPALGAPCSRSGTIEVCPPGTSCGFQPWLGTHCLADGAVDGARCRSTDPPCDPGLSCTAPRGVLPVGVCHPTVAPGAACDLEANRDACPSGTCQSVAAGPRCVPDGALFGACNPSTPECDPGLVCVPFPDRGRVGSGRYWHPRGRCLAGALPSGAPCDPRYETGACTDGEACTPVMGPTGGHRCMRAGAAASRCRAQEPRCDAGLTCAWIDSDGERCVASTLRGAVGLPCRPHAPSCDPGLACTDGGTPTCVTPRPVGTRCFTNEPEACATGSSCAENGTGPSGLCAPLGSLGARCRLPPARCDAGLVCNTDGRCASPVALGARCSGDPWGIAACEGLAICDSTCRSEGREGGFCRRDAVGCDAGLRCAIQSRAIAGFTSTVCWRPRARGESCEHVFEGTGAPSGDPPCAPGTACSDYTMPWSCAALGDPGTPCVEAAGRDECHGGATCIEGLCRVTLPLGSACTGSQSAFTCADGGYCDARTRTCLASPSPPAGAAGGPCRATGARCDDGLVCERPASEERGCVSLTGRERLCDASGGCVPSGAVGERCSPVALPTGCVAGAVCDQDLCVRADASSSGYIVERREGAAFLGVCGAPAATLPERFPFTFFGDAYDNVAIEDGFGTLAVVLRGGPSAVVRPRILPVASLEPYLDVASPDGAMRCARAFGSAPTRRLAFEWRYQPVIWHSNLVREYLPTISGTARFEVILEEDTHAIEMRYERVQTTDSPPLDFVIDPRIEGRGRAHLGGVRVRPGTAIRFTPR